MKKTLTILLCLIMLVSLCACGGKSETVKPDDPAPTPAQAQDTQPAAEPEPEPASEPEPEPEIVSQEIDFKNTNIIGEDIEITFKSAFAAESISPPMSSSVHITYSAPDGKAYVVLSADIKNLTDNSARISDLIVAAIFPSGNSSGSGTGASYYGLSDGGSSIESYPVVDPLATISAYIAFPVSKGSENDDYDLVINDSSGGVYYGSFSVEQFEDSRPELTVGETVADDTIEFTVDDVYYSDTLYPPMPGSYYHYYEAESGKTYLIVKVTAKNLKGSEMKYDSIAGVTCEYNDKYNYNSFCVLEEDGGSDLDGYPSQYSIAPLDTGVCYYLHEVPAEVQNGPTVITVYVTGNYYTIKAP